MQGCCASFVVPQTVAHNGNNWLLKVTPLVTVSSLWYNKSANIPLIWTQPLSLPLGWGAHRPLSKITLGPALLCCPGVDAAQTFDSNPVLYTKA